MKDPHKYAPALKRELARRYLAGESFYRVAAEEYGLSGGEVARKFVRWYRRRLRADDAAALGEVSPGSLAPVAASARPVAP